MTKKLLIASHNKGKIEIYKDALKDCPYELVTLADLGITYDVEETGTTYAENAILKAQAYAQMSGLITLADDTGLEVAALNGEPGLHSARYAGANKTDEDRINLLLHNLSGIPKDKWQAKFHSTVALAIPNKEIKLFTGNLHGMIVDTPRGDKGFGYCPIFFMPELGKTYAEIDVSERNHYSHRAQACKKLVDFLKTF